VAQVTANVYAITARGFNGATANKLLVLIDGRSVYTPLYSGVFWDVQSVMPEDIDRIEVISGPGAALWGPNAVNGVINIITRKSSDTLGAMVTVAPGDFENAARLRYGGTLGGHTTWRGYGLGFYRDHTVSATGTSVNDGWHNLQGGARVDWDQGKDAVTVQGDINKGEINQNVPADQRLTGHNLLGRWTRRFDKSSELQLQAYYDYSKRLIPGGSGDSASVYDLDIQHSFSFGSHHNIVWGGGYRSSQDDFVNPPTGGYFSPTSRTLNVFRSGHDRPRRRHQIDPRDEAGDQHLHRCRSAAERQALLERLKKPTRVGGRVAGGAHSGARRSGSLSDRGPGRRDRWWAGFQR
jgi:iron complex outermembrane receptor protein